MGRNTKEIFFPAIQMRQRREKWTEQREKETEKETGRQRGRKKQ